MKRIQTNTNKNNEQHNAPNINEKTCVALANNVNGFILPVRETHWPLIESKIWEIAKNINKDIYFQSAGIYKGFLLIKCDDRCTLKVLCRCFGKMRSQMKGMSLSIIPASQISKILENQSLGEPVVKMTRPETKSAFTNAINYSESDRDDHDESNRQQNFFDANGQQQHSATNMPNENVNDDIRATYIRDQRFVQQMANMDRLTKGQKRNIKQAKKRISKCERTYGLSCAGTVRQQPELNHTASQKEAVYGKKLANKHNEVREIFDPDYARSQLPSAFLSNCDPQLQNFTRNENYRRKSPGSELPSISLSNCDPELRKFNRNENYRTESPRSAFTSTSFSYCESELPNFNRNENYRTESPRSEFTSTSRSYLETEMMPAHAYPSMNFDNSNSESLYKRRNDQRVDSFSRTNGNSTMRGDWSDFPSTSRSGFQIPAEQYSRAEDYYETAHFSSKRCRTDSISNTKRWPDYTETNADFLKPTNTSSANNFYRRETNAELRPTNNGDWDKSAKDALEERILECLDSFRDEFTTPQTQNESSESVSMLKHKLNILRRENTDQSQNDAIMWSKPNILRKGNTNNQSTKDKETNSDDNKRYTDMEGMTRSERYKAREEYFTAINYLAAMKFCKFKLLTPEEKVQVGKCRHTVKKYRGIFRKKKADPAADVKMSNSGTTAKQSSSNSSLSTLPSSSHSPISKHQELNKNESGFWKCGNGSSFPNNSQPVKSIASKNLSNTPQASNAKLPAKVTEKTASQDHNTKCNESDAASYNPDLHIAIIDGNQEDGKISKEGWLKIEQGLLEQLAEEMMQTNNTNIGMFDGTCWRHGIKIIQCENVESLNFIKRFINNAQRYGPNTQYKAIPVREVPKRSVVKVSLPPPVMEDTTALKVLRAQNCMFHSLDWTLVNSRINEKGKDLFISISSNSVEKLRKANGMIRYGIKHVKIVLPG